MRSAAVPTRLIVALCVAGLAAAQVPGETSQSSVNPCPGDKSLQAAPACEAVEIPPGMCGACPLNEPLANGKFQNCKNIFNLDFPGCKEKLEEYVKLNPCDTVRKQFLEAWDQPAKDSLNYFAYALCEQCCDNVPKGSKIEEYDQRDKDNTLWSLERGNGPAHFHYDICAIYPNFKKFKLSCGDDEPTGPAICPQLQAWIDSPDSENWVQNENANMSPDIKNAIADSMDALQCDNKALWTSCVNLEAKQGRV